MFLSIARVVRETGINSLPVNASSIEDLPVDLFMALNHAYLILSWQENMLEDECPPHWMWHLDHELKAWFERIKAERKKKFSSDDAMEEPSDWMVNDSERARELRGY